MYNWQDPPTMSIQLQPEVTDFEDIRENREAKSLLVERSRSWIMEFDEKSFGRRCHSP
jgi:hypothetical protein